MLRQGCIRTIVKAKCKKYCNWFENTGKISLRSKKKEPKIILKQSWKFYWKFAVWDFIEKELHYRCFIGFFVQFFRTFTLKVICEQMHLKKELKKPNVKISGHIDNLIKPLQGCLSLNFVKYYYTDLIQNTSMRVHLFS